MAKLIRNTHYNPPPRFVACSKCRAIDQTLVKVDHKDGSKHYECQDKLACKRRQLELKKITGGK